MRGIERRVVRLEEARNSLGSDARLRALSNEELVAEIHDLETVILSAPDLPAEWRREIEEWCDRDPAEDLDAFGAHIARLHAMGCEGTA